MNPKQLNKLKTNELRTMCHAQKISLHDVETGEWLTRRVMIELLTEMTLPPCPEAWAPDLPAKCPTCGARATHEHGNIEGPYIHPRT